MKTCTLLEDVLVHERVENDTTNMSDRSHSYRSHSLSPVFCDSFGEQFDAWYHQFRTVFKVSS